MTIGGAARSGATGLAVIVGLVLALALSWLLPLFWALLVAAGAALLVYLVAWIFSVGPFEERLHREARSGQADDDAPEDEREARHKDTDRR